MAESYDRQRRRRRRDRGDFGRHSTDVSPSPSKPPVTILGLAKPTRAPASNNTDDHSTGPDADPSDSHNASHHNVEFQSEGPAGGEKTSVLLQTSDNKTRSSHVRSTDSESVSTDSRSHHEESSRSAEDSAPVLQRKASAASAVGNLISGVIDQGAQIQSKLAPPLERQANVKLIDGNFQWVDSGLELMLEQTDFLVVGVIGFQGCGKSTIMSLLAGNTHQDAYRNYIFFPQTKEAKEDGLYQTSGVDMFVTSERVIFLDTQPLLSASMMDCLLRYERKIPSEYSSLQNFIEMQSMQLLTFLLSVCNIVLVADDWFIDLNLLRIIQDAEMLKPSTQPPSSTSGGDMISSKDDSHDFYPTMIFVHNKASRDDFTPQTYSSMQQVLHKAFLSSKLKIHGGINMTRDSANGSIIQGLPSEPESESNPSMADVNLLLIPTMEFYKSEPDWLETTLPEYRGYPSFNNLLSFFRSQILSAPRSPVTHSTLTEKNWYHFAARMWESVKKSALLSEYNRLLSSIT